MILQVFWQLCTKTPPSKLHWIYTHLIPCLQSRDRILPPRPFRLLQLVHAKLPSIICGDNKWQGEKRNRTSDNYRLWAGERCTADKNNTYSTKPCPILTDCNFPKSKAMRAPLLLLWPLLGARLRAWGNSFSPSPTQQGERCQVRRLYLQSKSFLEGTALNPWILKYMGPLYQRYPTIIIMQDNSSCPLLNCSKAGVFRLASNGSRTQQAPWMMKKGPCTFRFPQILVFIGSVSTCSTHTKDYITQPRVFLARKTSQSAGSLFSLFFFFNWANSLEPNFTYCQHWEDLSPIPPVPTSAISYFQDRWKSFPSTITTLTDP